VRISGETDCSLISAKARNLLNLLNSWALVPSRFVYSSNYKYADICVVPLLSTKFNGMKSNLKVLEAAHMGLPVIASNVHPYKDMPGVMYVNKSADWYDLLNDFDQQRGSAGVLSDYCKEHYNFDKINLKRREAFV